MSAGGDVECVIDASYVGFVKLDAQDGEATLSGSLMLAPEKTGARSERPWVVEFARDTAARLVAVGPLQANASTAVAKSQHRPNLPRCRSNQSGDLTFDQRLSRLIHSSRQP